jgi:beta-glucosidase/6-phospho-beta-glucosidase/beta-galactosidase
MLATQLSISSLLLQISTFKLALDWNYLAGDTHGLDEDAIQFYISLVDQLQQNGINPHVTLFEKEIPTKIKVHFMNVQ